LSYRKLKNESNIECQIINYDYKDKMFKYLTSNKFCVDFQKNYPHEFSPLINIMVLKDDFFRPLTLPHLLCKPEISKNDLLDNFKNMSINFFFSNEPKKFDEFINSFGINFNEGKLLSEKEWYEIVSLWLWSRFYKEALFFEHYHNNILNKNGKDRCAFLISKFKFNDDDNVISLFKDSFNELYTTEIKTFLEIKFTKKRIPLFNKLCLESIDRGVTISPFIKYYLFSAFAEYIVFSDYYYYFILPCESSKNSAYWSIAAKKKAIKNKEKFFLDSIKNFIDHMNPKINLDDIGKTKKHISSNYLNIISADNIENIISDYSQYQELRSPKGIASVIVIRKYKNDPNNERKNVNSIVFYFSKSEEDLSGFKNLTIQFQNKIEAELPIFYKHDKAKFDEVQKIESTNEKGEIFEKYIKELLSGIGILLPLRNDDFYKEIRDYFSVVHKKKLDHIIVGPNPCVFIACEMKSSTKKEEVNKGERYLADVFLNEITSIRKLFDGFYKEQAEKMVGLKTILFTYWDNPKNEYKSRENLHVFTKQDYSSPSTIRDKIIKLLC